MADQIKGVEIDGELQKKIDNINYQNIGKKVEESMKSFDIDLNNLKPSLSIDFKVNTLYKVGDIVKTPDGKYEVEEVRLTIKAIFSMDQSFNFNNMSLDDAKYNADPSVDIFYKFKSEDEQIFYSQDQLVKFYNGEEFITTKKIIQQLQGKEKIKKRKGLFKKLFSKK